MQKKPAVLSKNYIFAYVRLVELANMQGYCTFFSLSALTLAFGSYIASLVPPPIPQTRYILISPLLKPIASFTTFFTSTPSKSVLSREGFSERSSSIQSILAIYGTGDIFALSTGRYRRYFASIKEFGGDRIRAVEVEGGGHFWLDAQSKRRISEAIEAFIAPKSGKQSLQTSGASPAGDVPL